MKFEYDMRNKFIAYIYNSCKYIGRYKISIRS